MTTVKQLSDSLSMDILTCREQSDREVKGCYICDLLSWAMSRCSEGDAWVTVQTNVNVIAVASLTEAACVIFPEGIRGDEDALKRAEQQGVVCLSAKQSAAELACGIKALV